MKKIIRYDDIHNRAVCGIGRRCQLVAEILSFFKLRDIMKMFGMDGEAIAKMDSDLNQIPNKL